MKYRDFVGHTVKLVNNNGEEFVGWVVGYTPACDNDPEVACLDMRIDGYPFPVGFDIPDISSIEVCDDL